MEDLVEVADFLNEGFYALEFDKHMTWDDFLGLVLRLVKSGLKESVVAVFFSKNGKPLGFVIVVDESYSSLEKVAHVFAGYSNGKYVGAANEAIVFAEEWAKQNGFSVLQASSRRMNGAAMRLFKQKLQFRPAFVVFEKGLK